jgi:putative hydrolase of the HAD superfamily
MPITTLFFDLDDTLYSHTAGLWEAIRVRMDVYMHERMGIDWGEIPALRRSYFETYGTTLRGLQNHLHVDPQDFLAYVHDLPLKEYLQPDPSLREMLLSLPQKCWIFTNADSAHAARVLAVLELQDCFDGVIDVNALEFIPKPDPEAYMRALRIAGTQGDQAMIFDDALRNLLPAKQLGFTTVMVGPNHSTEADYHLAKLVELPEMIPGLWNSHPVYSRQGKHGK